MKHTFCKLKINVQIIYVIPGQPDANYTWAGWHSFINTCLLKPLQFPKIVIEGNRN